MAGKGDKRRQEDRKKISARWPFKDKKKTKKEKPRK